MADPTILIVEDERDTVEMYRIVLEVEGYQVMVAYTLQGAIKQLEKKRPDLVLLDVALRGTSGLDLCEKIRGDPELVDLPVVIISNLGSPEDITAGLAAGANAYLTKPISQDELLEAVHQNLLPQSPESASDTD
jgi:two-component system alkaline phosphatase synthesis response regulator PhoP